MLLKSLSQTTENRRRAEWLGDSQLFMHAYILLAAVCIDTQKPPGLPGSSM